MRSFPHTTRDGSPLDRHIKRVDTARYCLLYKFGGLYADLDFIFTENIDEILDEHFDLFFYRSTQAIVKEWAFLGNALLISKPEQPFWLGALDYMFGLPANTAVAPPHWPAGTRGILCVLGRKAACQNFWT